MTKAQPGVYENPICGDCFYHTHARDYFATWGICKWCMAGNGRPATEILPEDVAEITS